MKQVRVGVVGLGMVAQIMHLPFLKELDEFEIAAVCDISESQARRMGDHYGVAARYTDHRTMLEKEDLDAVLILTFNHCEVAVDAAAAGAHILCEKPVCFSVQEGIEIQQAAEKAGVIFMVGYMKRYDESYLLGCRYFDEMKGRGEVRLIDVHDACFQNDLSLRSMYDIRTADDIPPGAAKQNQDTMRARLAQELGDAPENVFTAYRLLLETGSHDVNVLRGAFGDPERVVATEIWPDGNWFTTILDYGGDVRCNLCVARTARNWPDEHITAFGTQTTVSVEFPSPFQRNAETYVRRTTMHDDATTVETTCASHSEAFRNELLHFHDCMVNGHAPRTPIADAIEDTRLMAGIIKKYISG